MLNASMKVSKNSNCSVVSHIDSASLSLASKRRRLPNAALSRLISSFVSVAASARKMKFEMYFSPVSARYVVDGMNILSASRPL